ncbi:MAG: GNAT family N-acetyltransferase [Anaerolineae bacterium]|nr:GNAT family N-acetyltransferase [Anaerolineae bacterium]
MIYGEGIRFRAPERSDIPLFQQWVNDPDVQAGTTHFLPMSIAREEEWFEAMLKRPPETHVFTAEIEQNGNWTAIGNGGFFEFDWIARRATLGIMIGEPVFRGKGHGTKMMEMLLKIGFEKFNLNRIALDVLSNNPRAIHVYQKIGFILEGTARQDQFKNGEYLDLHTMGILRNEWLMMQDNG